MKWIFKKNSRGGHNRIDTDVRVRFYKLTNKNQNAKVYFTRSGLEKIGLEVEKLCFGIGEEGVFVTTENVGTVFTLRGHGNPNSKSVNSKELVSAIMKAFDCKEKIIDLDLKNVDKNVWQLVPKNEVAQTKWGWK